VIRSSYAEVLGLTPAEIDVRSGQRHDVVLTSSEAWRFPRTAAALNVLVRSADRARAAHELGLPAPAVVDVVPGALGVARMGLERVQGIGLSPRVTQTLPLPSQGRLAADLVALLTALRTARPTSWPADDEDWASRWERLADRLRAEVLPMIASSPGRRRAEAEVSAAVSAATAARTMGGLTHGDLGGENVLLDPACGAVVGVLDWDEATPGDPAVDLAAISAHAQPWLVAAIHDEDPTLRELTQRSAAYQGTFALQQALWGLESGNPGEVAEGLATYG
jgi:aminoglycoside phosphotransferase (APT) family kinase protein